MPTRQSNMEQQTPPVEVEVKRQCSPGLISASTLMVMMIHMMVAHVVMHGFLRVGRGGGETGETGDDKAKSK